EPGEPAGPPVADRELHPAHPGAGPDPQRSRLHRGGGQGGDRRPLLLRGDAEADGAPVAAAGARRSDPRVPLLLLIVGKGAGEGVKEGEGMSNVQELMMAVVA